MAIGQALTYASGDLAGDGVARQRGRGTHLRNEVLPFTVLELQVEVEFRENFVGLWDRCCHQYLLRGARICNRGGPAPVDHPRRRGGMIQSIARTASTALVTLILPTTAASDKAEHHQNL